MDPNALVASSDVQMSMDDTMLPPFHMANMMPFPPGLNSGNMYPWDAYSARCLTHSVESESFPFNYPLRLNNWSDTSSSWAMYPDQYQQHSHPPIPSSDLLDFTTTESHQPSVDDAESHSLCSSSAVPTGNNDLANDSLDHTATESHQGGAHVPCLPAFSPNGESHSLCSPSAVPTCNDNSANASSNDSANNGSMEAHLHDKGNNSCWLARNPGQPVIPTRAKGAPLTDAEKASRALKAAQ
ncbi:hypothetical protein EDD22DRAFT_960308 [Suillus occidentalis]|nr:hypothetical protein EDD22DRAFT_960308 [Suillus occidentalis]